jgi:hypothetical protein
VDKSVILTQIHYVCSNETNNNPLYYMKEERRTSETAMDVT